MLSHHFIETILRPAHSRHLLRRLSSQPKPTIRRSNPKPLPYSSRYHEPPAEPPELSTLDAIRASFRNSLQRLWTRISARRPHLHSFVLWTANSFILLHLFTQYIASINGCIGPSMLPTLHFDGDWVLISKLHARGGWLSKGYFPLAVGDLVSFLHPVIQGVDAIKRVVGMPGDFVLRDTPGSNEVMVQVPAGHIWVAGDNVEWTRDSRHYGPVPLGLVKGKVVARVLPWRYRCWFGNGLVQRDDEEDD